LKRTGNKKTFIKLLFPFSFFAVVSIPCINISNQYRALMEEWRANRICHFDLLSNIPLLPLLTLQCFIE
jgi:hypothetical protein